MNQLPDLYRIGKLGKPHGVKGEISFHFDDDIFDRVDADYIFLQVDALPVPFFIEEYRFRSDETALLKLEGIDTQEQARQLTGSEVLFPREFADNDEEGLSWAAIIGFQLVDNSHGTVVGTIASVDDSTQNILFEVTTPDDKDLLIPASEELIADVDSQGKTISVNLPEGLLDL